MMLSLSLIPRTLCKDLVHTRICQEKEEVQNGATGHACEYIIVEKWYWEGDRIKTT